MNRIGDLVHDIRGLDVDRDEKRELLTVMATLSDGTVLPARALSDGTLRFLALAVLEEASQDGVFCLEEPENGIFPDQLPLMIELLTDLALDPQLPPGDDNPLRQVIVNTHAPSVVARVDEDSLVLAGHGLVCRPEASGAERVLPAVQFSALSGTWRTDKAGTPGIPRNRLIPFMDPLGDPLPDADDGKPRRLVKDRPECQLMLQFQEEERVR